MHKLTAAVLALGTGLFFVGCAVEEDQYSYSEDRPVYYSDGYNDDVDFYYVSSRPYSRSYGPLYLRDGRYYYSSGGSYAAYDRPTRVYRNTNIVNRTTNVRNVRYNNERVVRNQRATRDYNRYDRSAGQVQRRTDYRQRSPQASQVRVSNSPGHRPDVRVVEKKKKKKD
jgi:hypothetical protein